MVQTKIINEIDGLMRKREERAKLLRAAARIAPDEAEDVLQDGLVQALVNAGTFREESRPSSWLYRVVVNAGLMRRRKAKRAARYVESVTRCTDDAPWATGGQRHEAPDSQLSRCQEVVRLRAAVRELPAAYREAVEDWLLAERDPQAAANDLGITRSCLRTRGTRARHQLVARLQSAA